MHRQILSWRLEGVLCSSQALSLCSPFLTDYSFLCTVATLISQLICSTWRSPGSTESPFLSCILETFCAVNKTSCIVHLVCFHFLGISVFDVLKDISNILSDILVSGWRVGSCYFVLVRSGSHFIFIFINIKIWFLSKWIIRMIQKLRSKNMHLAEISLLIHYQSNPHSGLLNN